MKLKSSSFLYCLLILFLYFTPLKSEKQIDIWDKKEKKQSTENKKKINKKESQKLNLKSIQTIELNQNIQIENKPLDQNKKENKVFGIYDPAENDFSLNMWSSTKAEEVKSSFKKNRKSQIISNSQSNT